VALFAARVLVWVALIGQNVSINTFRQPQSLSLPANYKEKYVAGRVKKNEKFAKYLESMGKKELADQIRNDKSIILPEEFNPAKTWTEYINRLTGAILGVFLLLTAIYSFTYRKTAKRVIVLSILNVLLTGYQGWLGSIVVSTNLNTVGSNCAHVTGYGYFGHRNLYL
jgi:hypothetical protein